MKRLSAGLLAAALVTAAALLVIGGTALTTKAGGEEGDHAQTTVTAAPQDLPALVAGTNAFTLDLFKAVRSDSQNLVLSPYSISTALAMTYAGAKGSTASQMATALHFTVPQDQLPAAFQELARSLGSASAGGASGKSFQLSIANSLWGQEDFPFLPPFLDVLQKQYGSPLRKTDFARSSEKARQAINDWVKDRTKGKIVDLLPTGSLDAMTRLVLANAVYFKADWQSPFAHEETSNRDFRLVDGTTTTVPTMTQTASFGYTKMGGWEAVELPYQGERYAMVALLPEASLADSLPGLTADSLSSLVKQLTPTQISLAIPKWTYKSGFSLKDALTTLGMPDAFADADFSGMDGRKDLAIDDVYHKAFVAVDEKGTEAAAATGVVMRLTAMLAPAPQVTFDRPFIYLIRDRQTGAILFVGQVTDPGAASTE